MKKPETEIAHKCARRFRGRKKFFKPATETQAKLERKRYRDQRSKNKRPSDDSGDPE